MASETVFLGSRSLMRGLREVGDESRVEAQSNGGRQVLQGAALDVVQSFSQ